MKFVAPILLCVIGLIAIVGCDFRGKDEDETPTTSEQETSTETQNETDPMSTESESQSPSTEETSETESQSATVETESQTQGSDTIAAACDALADCEWQYDDCVEFTNPDDRECLSLTLCGGTKLATRQEACDIQCPLGECQISQAIEHIDSDTASLDLCAEPGELRCR